jgi:PIN domain nuclease of toxin-antitoxin system
MRILLDTHAFLWAITDDERLSKRAREIFTSAQKELLFSVAGVWEILTKVQIGKLSLPKSAGSYLTEQLVTNDIQVVSIRMPHVLRLERLPMHHRDPFDRILIAQSLEEELPILSADPALQNYSATILW